MSTSLLKEQLELSWKADVSDDVNKEVFDQDDSISSGDLADIQDLTNEQLAETKDQLFQCERDLEKLEEESARKIKLLRDDIERYQQERDEECSKYDALNQTHIELKLNYENQINENKSLRSEIDAEIELRQKLQIQYDTLQDQKANSAMAFDESKYIVEAKYLKTQVEELKKELSDLRDRNSVLRDDNYVLKTQNENYIMKSNELNFELEEIIKHRGDLTAQNVQMSDDLRISLKKCIGLQEEVDHLSASYELLTGEYDNKMKLYNDLLDEMKNIQMMNDNLKLALEEANTDVNSLKDELHITKQLTNELQSNKEEWLSHEEKLFYQEMQDAEEKIAHLTKEYSDIVESLESQKIGYEEKLNDKSKQIQDFQSVIDRQRGEYEHSINLHEKEMKSALKMVEDLEVELKECKATIQHHEDDERARRNELLKEISRLKSKSVEDCNRVLITLTGLQQVIRQMCTESMANRDSLKVLYAEHVQTRNMMKKLDVCHQLVIPSNTMDYSESSSPVTGGNKDIDCTRYDRKLFASNQVELGQHPILQYGDLMSRLLRAFLKKMDQHDADRKELNKMLDGVKSTLLEEQHQYRLLSRTNDASMIEIAANKKMMAQYQSKIEHLQAHIKVEKEEHNKVNRNLTKTINVVEEQLSIQTEKNLKLQNELNLLTADANHRKELEDNKMAMTLQKVLTLETTLVELKEAKHKIELSCKECHADMDAMNIKMKKQETEYQNLRRSSYQYAERAGEDHKKFVKKIDILETTVKQYRQQIKALQHLNATLQGQRAQRPTRHAPNVTSTINKRLDYSKETSMYEPYVHQPAHMSDAACESSAAHLIHTNPYTKSMHLDMLTTPNMNELDSNFVEMKGEKGIESGKLNHSTSTASTVIPHDGD